ncbi:MAG TPA: hypothetical protein VMH83_05390 [Candidatus Acidoferrum sp.]|nr:hypothetical protein [Candidatus Acidoferrum sp.]
MGVALLSVLLSVLLSMTAGISCVYAADAPPPAPAPRDANGKVLLSNAPGQKTGLWVTDYSTRIPMFDLKNIAFKPWAKALLEVRQTQNLEPHTRCKPSGAIRQFLTPYGVEILDMPELQQVYIFDLGGPHTWRTIYMDGRGHPADLEPTYYGHSIGHWEGDTLVVDSVGYNTGFWFERSGLPHTEAVHVVEYFTRRDKNTMEYRFVMTDPQTYDAPVEGKLRMKWSEGEELFEYVCQQSNYAPELMVRKDDLKSIGKSSPIIP